MIAIVLGGAETVWEDFAALGMDGCVFAVNAAIPAHTGRIEHACTLHAENLGRWCRDRERAGRNMDFDRWTHKAKTGCGPVNVRSDWGGSSGLFAVKIARELGFERIVLCGVPMDARLHFDRPGEWPDCHHYRRHWLRMKDEISPFVRSMSGWTRELLGSPDDAWLGRAVADEVSDG